MPDDPAAEATLLSHPDPISQPRLHPAPLLVYRSEKKFPWQNGIHISDLKVLLPGAKIREAEALRAQREAAR